MAVLALDLVLKSMFEAAINDLRKNPWILDDVFGGLANDALTSKEYGYKEVAAAKKWFLSANIDVVLQFRVDDPRFPTIAISKTGRNELAGQRTNIGDEGQIEDFDPKDVTSRPPNVYAPFNPRKFNNAKGIVTFPKDLDTEMMVPGQFLVSQKSGKAYQILKVLDDKSFTIKANVQEDFTGAYIVPAIYMWNLHREITYAKETYTIDCCAESDVAKAQWLHDLAWYILCRYKEAFIEGRGFELSTMSSGALEQDRRFEPQVVFCTKIQMSGDNQISWVKFVAPKIQAVRAQFKIADGPATPPGYLEEVEKQGWEMENDPPFPDDGVSLQDVEAIGDLADPEHEGDPEDDI